MTLYEGSAFLQEVFTNTIPTSADVFAPAGTQGYQASRSDSVLLQNDSQFAQQAVFDTSFSKRSQYDDGIYDYNASYTQDNALFIYGFDVGLDFVYNDSTLLWSSTQIIARTSFIDSNDKIDTIVGRTGDFDPVSGDIYDAYYVFVDVTPEEQGI